MLYTVIFLVNVHITTKFEILFDHHSSVHINKHSKFFTKYVLYKRSQKYFKFQSFHEEMYRKNSFLGRKIVVVKIYVEVYTSMVSEVNTRRYEGKYEL